MVQLLCRAFYTEATVDSTYEGRTDVIAADVATLITGSTCAGWTDTESMAGIPRTSQVALLAEEQA